MLDIKGIYKTFNPGSVNEKHALNGVDLHLNEGDFVTVIGGNGAGKSTLLNAVAGVWPVDKGRIFIDGKDVTSLPEYKRAKYLGRVFQDPMTGTAANMQIEENLALAARRGSSRGLRWEVTKKEREEYRAGPEKEPECARACGRRAPGRHDARSGAPGADPCYGNACQAKAFAFG